MSKIKIVILFLIVTFSVNAQFTIDYNDLQFKVAVYSPSDEIFSWWGHAALVVEYTRWNYERVFDWGINSHPNESFIADFIDGLVEYKVISSIHYIGGYIEEDRDIVIYTLDIDNSSKEKMLSYMENRVLPENCYYEYHEFLDNCSTGVRDVINLGTNGQFMEAFSSIPGRFTYRQHVQRYTWFRPFADWLMGFLMGQNLDEEISVWEEMFLPVEIARNIVDFKYIDNSGMERNLVSSVQIINSSRNRHPILHKPLVTWPFFLAAGLFIMTLLFLIKSIQKKYPRFGRIFYNLIQCILGLLFGLCGCVLTIGLFMDTEYIRDNINILFINPLILIIVPLGILAAVNVNIKIKSALLLRIVWTYIFITAAFTLFIRILPDFFQQNQAVCAFVLHVTFALGIFPSLLARHLHPPLLWLREIFICRLCSEKQERRNPD